MKNLILGLVIVGLTFACKSNDTMSVDDAGDPNMAAECGGGGCEDMGECSGDMKAECSDEMKAECSGDMKAECSGDMKAECSGEKPSECSGDKPAEGVCPVTGAPIN